MIKKKKLEEELNITMQYSKYQKVEGFKQQKFFIKIFGEVAVAANNRIEMLIK